MKLGFIGTGALTSAIVTGLKSVSDNDVAVLLSPRNEQISSGLAARYADVEVAAGNQDILDQCDTVVLAVRPQVAHEVISALRFRAEQHVISLIATLSRDEVAALTAPAQRITKALPMPMAADRQGATIIYPPDPDAAALFGKLGKAIEVEDVNEFDALSVVTATFATYFKYLDTIHAWLVDHGVPAEKGRDYVAALFRALGHAPELGGGADFMHLSREYATRGGINEQVLRELTERGLFDAVSQSLDGIHRRIVGTSTPA